MPTIKTSFSNNIHSSPYTYTNYLGDYGDFESSYWISGSGYSGAGYSNSSTANCVYGTKCFKGVIDSQSGTKRIETPDSFTLEQHQYYVSCYILALVNKTSYFKLNGTGFGVDPFNPTADVWYRMAKIFDFTSTAIVADPLRIYHDNSAPYAIGHIVYWDAVMIVDLTNTFGSGNEPSLEVCNNEIPFFNNSNAPRMFSKSLLSIYH